MLQQSALVIAVACAAVLASASDAQLRRPLRMDKSGINPLPERATSFDCKKAKLRVEQMICHNAILAMEDGSMGESLYFMKRKATPAARAALIRSQRAWLQRRNSCGDYECVEAAYEQRSSELQRIAGLRAKYLMRNVARVGQCESTKIDWIGPRLEEVEGEAPDGTSVGFEDAVEQVSYDREPQVLASRVGDTARVCLISIPQHCPPGDARGKVYRVTNLRTGKRWELPDSSHRCGGA
jgi:uncharacterized protein